MTSSPNDLTSRLRSRLEADRRQIEETAARELEQLGESLSAVASDALRSIEADTAAATARVSVLLRRADEMVTGLRRNAAMPFSYVDQILIKYIFWSTERKRSVSDSRTHQSQNITNRI